MALRNEDLRAHDVDTGDHFGNGVLDLDAGVHLDEVVVAFAVDEEFHGAGRDVADLLRDLDRVCLEGGAGLLRNGEGGGVFDDLLEPALKRAVTFAEVDDVAVLVGEDLHLDVLRVHEELLDEDVIVVEGLFGFALDEAIGVADLRFGVAAAHAASAAAGGRFQDDREAEGLGDLGGFVRAFYRLGRAGDGRDLGREGDLFCLQFIAHFGENGRRRSDEGDVVVLTGFGKVGILRQEPVARVDGIDAVVLGQLDDGGDIEIRLQRALVFSDEIGLVRFDAEEGIGVFGGIHGDGAQAEVVAGAEDADGDLTAVGSHDSSELNSLHSFISYMLYVTKNRVIALIL